MAHKQEYEKVYTWMLIATYVITAINIYHFAHPLFAAMGLSHEAVREILIDLRNGGLLKDSWVTKLTVWILLLMCHIVRSGKGKTVSPYLIATVIVTGTATFFVFPSSNTIYIVTTIIGFIMLSWGFAMIGRTLHGFNQDVNDDNETFEQCNELIETEDSINIQLKYQYKKKIWKGWINVVNPFRATMILGTPGSGKSFSVYNPFMKQMIHKGYAMFVYDYKFPDLTEVIYNEMLRKYPPIKNPLYRKDPSQPEWIREKGTPEFLVINFKDPRYSNRCNPIHARYLDDPADSAEVADIIMKNVNPSSVEKEDFFSMSAKVYLDAIIWFLKLYENGRYCTFPHVIELMAQDYKKVFAILSGYQELETKIKPFASALEAGAQDQLQGQIASAQIPLNKMASPQLYWVLSGDDFSLDINNPEEPKVLCVGNDPDRQTIYGTTLALYTSRMFKLINHKGKRKCGVLLDELPTIFIKGLDNLIATARSNKVAIVLGAQDKTQLIRDYTQKEADVIFNTVGNIFAGQVNGKTAEDLNKSFGREKRRQESQTQNIDSESLNVSFHDEELMPIRKIETLTQGYFFGKVADNNSTPIAKKLFCGEIQVDPERFPGKCEKKLPVMTDFGDEQIKMAVWSSEYSSKILKQHFIPEVLEDLNGVIEDPETMDKLLEAKIKKMSATDKAKILDTEAERLIKERVAKMIEDNFKQIRKDMEDLIERELPEENIGFTARRIDDYSEEGFSNEGFMASDYAA